MSDANTEYMMKNKRFFDQFIVVMILGVVLAFIGQFIGLPIDLLGYHYEDSFPELYTVFLYLTTLGSWVASLLFMLIYKPDRPLIPAVFKGGNNTLKYFLIGGLVGFVMNGSCILVSVLHKDLAFYPDPSALWLVLLAFIAVLIQSGSEELLCRHVMQLHLRRRYNKPWLEILLPSLTFAILHLLNPGITVLSVLNLVLCGVLMSSIVYYFDSLWMAIGVHTLWNFTQAILFGLPNSGQVLPLSVFHLDAASARNSFSYHVNFGVEGSLMAFLVQAIALGCVIWLGEKRKKARAIEHAPESTEQ